MEEVAFGTAAVEVGQKWKHVVVEAGHQDTLTVVGVFEDGEVKLRTARGDIRYLSVGHLLAYWIRVEG